MKHLKKGILAFVLILATVVLAGCGGGMSEEEAKDYVQATLDANYKGEVDALVEHTDATKEEAEKMYQQNIESGLQNMGLDELGFTEEQVQLFEQIAVDLMKQAKYSVGEVKESDDSFEVYVKAEPFTGFDNLVEDMEAKTMDKLSTAQQETPELLEDDAKVQELVVQIVHELMSERIANPTYGEPQDIPVKVVKNSDGAYEIVQEDLDAVDDALFSM